MEFFSNVYRKNASFPSERIYFHYVPFENKSPELKMQINKTGRQGFSDVTRSILILFFIFASYCYTQFS